ncbi:Leucine-, isoleucine-, valine-, threonine-, and alanine-binding protein [bacterium HR11]|nr:Leucine-, isoleucine-, valine-, threonine-, and alanine-binding protein [bacterium HR11]
MRPLGSLLIGMSLWLTAAGVLGRPPEMPVEPVRVGALFSLTGTSQSYGEGNRQGLQMAVDEINAAGGIRGRPVEVLWGDDGSQPQQAAAVASRWVRERQVVAIIGGTTSEVARPVATLCQKASMVFIMPFATHPDLTKGATHVFRVSFSDVNQARAAAAFARQELKLAAVWVLRDVSSAYSSHLSEAFRQEFESLGGRVEGVLTYDEATTDFTGILKPLKARASGPVALYLPGHVADTVRIVRTLEHLGISALLIGSDTWDAEDILKATGPAFRRGYYTTLYHPDLPGERNQAFVREYVKRFQKRPTPDAVAAYDAMHILAAALRKASAWDVESLRQALRTLDYEGPAGRIRFGPSGDAERDVVIVRIENGTARLHRLFRK